MCLFVCFSKLLLFAAGTHQLYLHPPFPTIAEKRKKAFNSSQISTIGWVVLTFPISMFTFYAT